MDNRSLILEVLKSNICKNIIQSFDENKPVQYTLTEAIEDGFYIGKEIAKLEQPNCQECNNFTTTCQQARSELVFKIFKDYIQHIDMGPSNIDFNGGFRIGLVISQKLAQPRTERELNLIAENLKTEIKSIASFTTADKHNLQIFVICITQLYVYDLKNGGKNA